MNFITEISFFLSQYFTELNFFGFFMIMGLMILAGLSLGIKGINLNSNRYNTKDTQLAGAIMATAGVCLMGATTIVVMAIDYAVVNSMISMV